MRWIVFATIQVGGLGSTLATVLHGPSPWSCVSAGSLLWLARRLLGPGERNRGKPGSKKPI
jgi:hypothetical protein